MTVTYDFSLRSQSAMATLEGRFEVVKDIGDGSFGSVVLAYARGGGSNGPRKGTMVAIKTMKKKFDTFDACMELREVIFLKTIPSHAHLVHAYDIFLDPLTKKLHICMEYMEGNLYMLMKARDHKCLDGKHVKSILYQILSGLEHIHAHQFFHRDVKPENILVSTSDSTSSRYSHLVTPPSTPTTYTVKLADFGLARETQSKLQYTTYVSTRWYRAPEVLLRAGEYSAPVDMWAVGAMAVEIATLKPLFPGSNEVDQVWRICEIMGSPGNWYNKSGVKVGGGEWREGTRLAQKLGFTFPKMAPHSMETILQPPRWPSSLSQLITSCLMWDPKNRPTSTQALNHEYFTDAVDPLRPKASTPRLLGRKLSDKSFKSPLKDSVDTPGLSSKASWFRRSLIGRSESPAPILEPDQARQSAASYNTTNTALDAQDSKGRSAANKRSTWTNGAPMPILPSIRPVSPLSNAVTAQANSSLAHGGENVDAVKNESRSTSKKIGRQLSVNSTGNHYADIHRQEAERALNGVSTQKESFFSHLRKKARRFSGRNQVSASNYDVEADAGCMPWSNRSSMALDPAADAKYQTDLSEISEIDKALQKVKYPLESSTHANVPVHGPSTNGTPLKRQSMRSMTESPTTPLFGGPISSRTRRALQMSPRPIHPYETPEEEDELLDEVLRSTNKAARRLAQRYDDSNSSSRSDQNQLSMRSKESSRQPLNPYPTPSPSAKRNGVSFGQNELTTPTTPTTPTRLRGINDADSEHGDSIRPWVTPPYEGNEWARSVADSILATGVTYR